MSLTRRTLIVGSTLLPASAALARAAQKGTGRASGKKAGEAVPDSVKSLSAPYPSFGSIDRLDPAFDALVSKEAKLEKLAEGFEWIEGPVWLPKEKALLFSEIPLNTIYRWQEEKGVSLYLKPAGYHGTRTDLKEPGSNGLLLGKKGELIMAQHGERRLAKLVSLKRPKGKQMPLVEKYDGKRFNSPNDLVMNDKGEIFFTDPPYGLAKQMDDEGKELEFQGIYRLDRKGKAHLLYKDMERPNGIGLSPDGKTLYVANSHEARPVIMAFDIKDDGSAANPRIFFNGALLREKDPKLKGAFDGMAIDKAGNLFATGPGGVLLITPQGKHLGTILTGEATANCTFGGADGSVLYITADMILARIQTATKGLGFA